MGRGNTLLEQRDSTYFWSGANNGNNDNNDFWSLYHLASQRNDIRYILCILSIYTCLLVITLAWLKYLVFWLKTHLLKEPLSLEELLIHAVRNGGS